MRFGSVCSGIEAASVAWHPMGWQTQFVSEIDPFASAVLAHRFPGVPNLGDMTRFQEWPDADLDVFVGGTPCQSFSVAGLRKGLADPRGNLMLTYLAIAKRYRPRWLVWENVPGVLSSNGGRDFGTFLGALGQLGYGFAYRILDAQFFGVPQRRRRVFVVANSRSWQRAAAVLFERHSLSGHPAPRRAAGEDAAPTLTGNAGRKGDYDYPASGGVICMATGQGNAEISHDASPALTCNHEAPIVAFGWQNSSTRGMSADAVTPTLDRSKIPAIAVGGMVRRITPREAERLQGFPDDWTLVPYRGRLATDSPRYKACGNSMAVPVMRWIGERIQMVDEIIKGAA